MSNPLLKMVEVLRAQYSEEQTDELTLAIQMELSAGIALIIPVPATPVGSSAQAWLNHDVFISRMLDDVNEHYLLDLAKVKADVKKIYETRYNFVHRPTATIDATNAIVKSIVTNREDAALGLRDLTITTLKGISDSAVELQKQYVAEVGGDEE